MYPSALGGECKSHFTRVRTRVPLTPIATAGSHFCLFFYKVLEVLIWRRLEGWWNRTSAVSGLQGACKKGCNSAFLLREHIATALEENDLVYVAYFDVA